MDAPQVAVWARTGTQWGVVGDLPRYDSLDADVRHNDVGQFSLAIPLDAKAAAVQPGRLLTVDWRGTRVCTGVVEDITDGRDSRGRFLEVSGPDTFLAWLLAWRNPNGQLPNQPLEDATPVTTGAAGSVVMGMIAANVVARRGMAVTVQSAAIGSTVRIRPNFDEIAALAFKKATRGGIGVRTNLVDVSGSRANLTVSPYLPADRSLRVLFAEDLGTLGDWRRKRTAPKTTRALVSGAPGQGFRGVTTTESLAAETAWDGRRETLVTGPQTFDTAELDEVGQAALDDGAETVSLSIEATETPQLRAFRDYFPGDLASVRLPDGTEYTDVVTAVKVSVSDDVAVSVTFGDPDGTSPIDRQAKTLTATRRDVATLKSKGI